MVAIMPAAEHAEIEHTTFSQTVSRVLGLDLHAWEQLMLVSLAFAALAAIAVVVTTAAVVTVQKSEAERAKNELGAYKLEAATKIAEANSAGEAAKKHAADANNEAERANERAAELEKGNLILQGDVERERIARLKLEEQLAPRSLSSDQQASLTAALAQFKGTALDILIYGGGSADALPLAGMISDALTAAGWHVRIWNTISPVRWVRGILVQTRASSDGAVENPAVALILALRTSLGDGVSGYEQFPADEKQPPESGLMGPGWEMDKVASIRMMVGSKPQ